MRRRVSVVSSHRVDAVCCGGWSGQEVGEGLGVMCSLLIVALVLLR